MGGGQLFDNQRVTGIMSKRTQTCAPVYSRMYVVSRHHHRKGRDFFSSTKFLSKKFFRRFFVDLVSNPTAKLLFIIHC